MTDTPQTAAPVTPVPPSVAYIVTMPGHGYPMGAQITDATTIAKLKANGTLGRFTVRVSLKQEK